MLPGVTYDRVDDDGLHVTVDGEPRVLDVDHVVVCAGQESERSLYDDLVAAGVDARTSSAGPTSPPSSTPSGPSSRPPSSRPRCKHAG